MVIKFKKKGEKNIFLNEASKKQEKKRYIYKRITNTFTPKH